MKFPDSKYNVGSFRSLREEIDREIEKLSTWINSTPHFKHKGELNNPGERVSKRIDYLRELSVCVSNIIEYTFVSEEMASSLYGKEDKKK